MSNHPHIVEVTDENFDQTVIAASHEVPILVDFSAEWCQPCKQMLPTLLRLVDEFAGGFMLGKIDIDQQPNLAAEAGVRSVPTVLVFRKGMVVDQFLGVQSETVIRSIIERNLFSAADKLMTRAATAAARSDWQSAATLARQAVDLEPDRGDLRFELAGYLVESAELDEAEKLLETLPREIRESVDTESLRARIDLARSLIDAPDRATLEDTLTHHPEESLPRYQLAAACLAQGEPEAALEHLLTLVRNDRNFRDDAPRKGMLAIFSQLDPDDPLVQRFRSQMFNALH